MFNFVSSMHEANVIIQSRKKTMANSNFVFCISRLRYDLEERSLKNLCIIKIEEKHPANTKGIKRSMLYGRTVNIKVLKPLKPFKEIICENAQP